MALIWKPRPGAKPDGRGEGNEGQAAHQEDMPLRKRRAVVLSYCPSNWAISTVHTPIRSSIIGSGGTGGGGGEAGGGLKRLVNWLVGRNKWV